MKKVFLLTFFAVISFCFNLSAQGDKQVVGKWKMVDVKAVPEKGGKLNKEQKEMEKQLKAMFAEEGGDMTMEFKANGSFVSEAKGEKPKKQTWKSVGNEIHKTEKGSDEIEKARYKITGNKLELTMLPAEEGLFMVMVLEKQ